MAQAYVPKPVIRASARVGIMGSNSPPDWGEEEPLKSKSSRQKSDVPSCHPLMEAKPKAPPPTGSMKWNAIDVDEIKRRCQRRSLSRSRAPTRSPCRRRHRSRSAARSSRDSPSMSLTPAPGAASAATAAGEERRAVMVKGDQYCYKGRGGPRKGRGKSKGKHNGKKGKGKGWRNQFCTDTGIYTCMRAIRYITKAGGIRLQRSNRTYLIPRAGCLPFCIF